MTSYLDGGWYVSQTRSRLRTEVIDGAMDVAGMLVRAGVPARRLLRLALKVRTLIVIADPLMRGTSRFGAAERETVAERLAIFTDDYPELQGFVNDCVEQVNGAPDMTAFYLHLLHVARMMQLLDHAVHRGIAGVRAPGTPLRKKAKKAKKAKKSRKRTGRRKAAHGKKTPPKKPAKRNAGRKKTSRGKGPAGKKSTGRKKTARDETAGGSLAGKRPQKARKPAKRRKPSRKR